MLLSLSCVCMWIFFCLLNLLCVYTGSLLLRPALIVFASWASPLRPQWILHLNHPMFHILLWLFSWQSPLICGCIELSLVHTLLFCIFVAPWILVCHLLYIPCVYCIWTILSLFTLSIMCLYPFVLSLPPWLLPDNHLHDNYVFVYIPLPLYRLCSNRPTLTSVFCVSIRTILSTLCLYQDHQLFCFRVMI